MLVPFAVKLLSVSVAVVMLASVCSASEVTVQSVRGRLWVVVQEADVQLVLAEISRATGVAISIASDAWVHGEQVTARVGPGSLEEVVRRLLRRGNFVFVYSNERLEAVRVYGEERATGARPFPANVAERMPTSAEHADAPETQAALRATALGDSDPSKRLHALVQLLTSQQDAVALDTVVRVLEREDNSEILDMALTLLRTKDSMPVEGLLAFARGHASGMLRRQALELLERGFNAAAVHDVLAVQNVLRTASRQDPDEGVRQTARRLLEAIDND